MICRNVQFSLKKRLKLGNNKFFQRQTYYLGILGFNCYHGELFDLQHNLNEGQLVQTCSMKIFYHD